MQRRALSWGGVGGRGGTEAGAHPQQRDKPQKSPWFPGGALQIWGQKRRRRCLLAPLFREKQEARTSASRAQGKREGRV